MDAARAALLLAQIEVHAPGSRQVLLTAARAGTSAGPVAVALARAAVQAGQSSRVVALAPDAHGLVAREADATEHGLAEIQLTAASLLDLEAGERSLHTSDGFTVVAGRGVLDDAATLLAVRLVDGVVLTVERGKTHRRDVARAAAQINEVGGRLVGAVLLV